MKHVRILSCVVICLLVTSMSAMGSNEYDLLFHVIKTHNIHALRKMYRPRSAGDTKKHIRIGYPNPDQFVLNRGTPLAHAAQAGNEDIFKFLFKRSKWPNKPGLKMSEGEVLTPLQIALLCGHEDITRFLFKKKVVAKTVLSRIDSVESISVARSGNVAIAKMLKKAAQ